MVYVLGSGIHFCETGGRLVFLDLPRDRYVCLEEAAEAVFRQIILEGAGEGAHPALDALVRQGILSLADRPQNPQPPPVLVPAERSGLDRTASIKPSHLGVVKAGLALLAARYSLRRTGLAQTLDALARRSLAEKTDERRAQDIDSVAAAFARLDLWLSPLDQCLPRSIAIASVLARRRICARLVIAVRLRPFLAHSWVQAGGLVINDRPDAVRTFSPILVI